MDLSSEFIPRPVSQVARHMTKCGLVGFILSEAHLLVTVLVNRGNLDLCRLVNKMSSALGSWGDCVGGLVCLSFSICFSGKDLSILGDHRLECAV